MKIFISHIIVLIASILLLGHIAYAVATREEIEKAVAQEADAQLEMAVKWRQLDKLETLDEKIKLAINCMRADPDLPKGLFIYNTKIGVQLTKDAKSFLLQHREAALPYLLEFVETPAIYSNKERRITNVFDLLADIGQRKAVVPLVRKLFALEKQKGWTPSADLCETLARMGDQDLIPQLLTLRPYENDHLQNWIYWTIAYASARDIVPTLIRQIETCFALGEPPPSSLVQALVGQADHRAGETLRKILRTSPDTADVDRYALRGLYELRENFDKLNLTGKQKLDLNFVRRYPYTLTRYPIRHRGPNDQLRDLIKKRIDQKKKALKKTFYESNVTDSGLKLQLKAEPNTVRVGDKIEFQVLITNLSEQPLKVMCCRQGSDLGWVMPKTRVDICDPNGIPVFNMPVNIGYYCDYHCAMVSPLKDDDLHQLITHEQFNILGPPAFQPYKLTRFAKADPGTYLIKITYDTTGKAAGAYTKEETENGGPSPRDDGTCPQGVAPVRLVSNIVKIKVLPIVKTETLPKKRPRTNKNWPFVTKRKKRPG